VSGPQSIALAFGVICGIAFTALCFARAMAHADRTARIEANNRAIRRQKARQ